MSNQFKRIMTFLILTFVLSSFSYFKIISEGTIEGLEIYVFMLMWVPGISGLITKLIYDKSLKGMGWKFGKVKYLLISYFIPLIACLVVYSIVWLFRIGGVDIKQLQTIQEGPDSPVFYIVMLLILSTFGIIGSAISAFGEELGWRGFFVPELAKKFSFVKVSLISGAIWSVYHYPVLFFADYNNDTSIVLSFLFFTISIFAISIIATYLRLASGSLWTGVMIHASHNLFVQLIFDTITVDKGNTKIFTTEFGLGLAVVYVVIAIYFYRKRSELPQYNY